MRRKTHPGLYDWLFFAFLLCWVFTGRAYAQGGNRLRRIQIHPHQGFTRITLFFQTSPDYVMSRFPGTIKLRVVGTDAPLFRKYRAYADSHVGGVVCSLRGRDMQIIVPVKETGAGVQLLCYGNPTVLALDIGPAVKRLSRVDIAPGREPILSGMEQFLREFDTPARAALPFVPTNLKKLQGLLSKDEVLLFQRGEGDLYKERGTEAAEIFSFFRSGSPAVRALASYRHAQALYLLERYSEALKAFQEAERIWPGYLGVAPELLQSYADVRARSGDFAGGRALLVRLINRLTGTAQAWTLLNRLADMSARHGELTLALGIYRSVVAHAEGTTAAGMAQMKLNDGGMFSLSRDRYREMLVKYQSLYEGPGDFELRDEALFKVVLLQALYGPAQEALEASVTYGIRYPLGIFGTVVKKIRTDLLLPVYREIYAAGDSAAMMRLVLENREYLASCFSDPDFAVRVAQACRRTGTLNLELPLFAYLAGRSWAAGSAPFMMARIVEDAVALGNHSLAESTGRSFLARFPGNWLAPRIHELLGRVDFEQDNLRGVMSELSFLNASERKPDFIESDYYLGKALAWGGDRRGAERALTRFTAGARRESPLLLDGYFAVADARVALKEYAGALSACQEGVKLASGEGADQFLFKMGGIYLQRGQVRDAESSWEKITRKGNDGIWSKLAAEAVRDLHWDMKISSELPRQSEK